MEVWILWILWMKSSMTTHHMNIFGLSVGIQFVYHTIKMSTTDRTLIWFSNYKQKRKRPIQHVSQFLSLNWIKNRNKYLQYNKFIEFFFGCNRKQYFRRFNGCGLFSYTIILAMFKKNHRRCPKIKTDKFSFLIHKNWKCKYFVFSNSQRNRERCNGIRMLMHVWIETRVFSK